MLVKFWEIKQYHYDTILFFQKGKFFELYEEDARIGHQEFDLKLTNRVKMSMVSNLLLARSFHSLVYQSRLGCQNNPSISGLRSFWPKVVCPFNFFGSTFNVFATGYKVGKVEQAETALGMDMRLAADKGRKSKAAASDDKIVRRVLNKIFTNGTLVDETLLLDEQAGHCVSIREGCEGDKDGSDRFGICVLDSSTSEFNMSSFDDDVCRTKMETMMRQLRPKEVIFTKVSS